jgi:hypothetical protein
MPNIEHTPLAQSEREALRRYADGLDDDWAVAILIGSAVWNVERLEVQLAETIALLREIAERTDVPADFSNAVVRLRWVHERAANAIGGR